MRTGECLNGSLSLYRSFLVPSFPSVLVNGRWVLDGAMAQVFAHEVGTGVGDQMTLVRDNRIPVCVLLIPLCPIEGLWLMCGFGEVHLQIDVPIKFFGERGTTFKCTKGFWVIRKFKGSWLFKEK